MLTRFLAIPQMQTPFDTLFEQAQPDTAKIFAAPFLVSDRISKRALLLLLRFQKIIICESAGIFVAQQPQKFRLFLFSKRALTFRRPFPAVLLFWEDGFFRFLRTLFCASKRALEEMEVKIEESEQWKFQTKTNQTGIPFPYRPSHSDGEAHLYRVPIVRGMPLSRAWFSVSGRGRGMYAHTTDETI